MKLYNVCTVTINEYGDCEHLDKLGPFSTIEKAKNSIGHYICSKNPDDGELMISCIQKIEVDNIDYSKLVWHPLSAEKYKEYRKILEKFFQ